MYNPDLIYNLQQNLTTSTTSTTSQPAQPQTYTHNEGNVFESDQVISYGPPSTNRKGVYGVVRVLFAKLVIKSHAFGVLQQGRLLMF